MSDCISRQAAIKAVEELHDCYNGFSDTYDKACIIGVLEEVPSAPVREAKRGRWINCGGDIGNYIKCSICGTVYKKSIGNNVYPWNFCPNCGADMREEGDGKD